MKILNNVISIIKKYSLLIIIAIVIIFFVNNYFKNRVSEKLSNKITVLNVKNDLLLKDNKEINKQLLLADNKFLKEKHRGDSIDKIRLESDKWANYWKKEHDKIAGDLGNVPFNDSYSFLLSVYVFTGNPEYLFNGFQVRAMHQTFLENKNKGFQLEAKEIAYTECTKELESKDGLIKLAEEKFELKSTQFENANQVIDNKDAEIEITSKQLKRQKFWGNVKTVAIPVFFVIGLLI